MDNGSTFLLGGFEMWRKINFNAQNIETETERSTLIKMPKKSKYEGWVFWYPTKLVRDEGGKGYNLSFSFSDTWEFKIFKQYKNGKGPEQVISIAEMKEAFGLSNDTIESANAAHDAKQNESYLNVTEPTPVDKEVEVDESLKR